MDSRFQLNRVSMVGNGSRSGLVVEESVESYILTKRVDD